ncbi:hypothetical protein [Bacillus toyonensis]|uniref:hypothetical protein n=1 Tax=Bacillus toyonensis TaxID=155322 RepID=UPI002E221F2E|nr:hypothetical protein [Bacillus toyonensis]
MMNLFEKMDVINEGLQLDETEKKHIEKLKAVIESDSKLITINDSNTPVYFVNSNQSFNDMEGKVLTLDLVNFTRSCKYYLDTWMVPTVEGYVVELCLIS